MRHHPFPGAPTIRTTIRHEGAEPLLLEAFRCREAKLGAEHPHTLDSLREFVSLYKSWDKPDETEQWRTRSGGRRTLVIGDN